MFHFGSLEKRGSGFVKSSNSYRGSAEQIILRITGLFLIPQFSKLANFSPSQIYCENVSKL